jgi:hypothetical protein
LHPFGEGGSAVSSGDTRPEAGVFGDQLFDTFEIPVEPSFADQRLISQSSAEWYFLGHYNPA